MRWKIKMKRNKRLVKKGGSGYVICKYTDSGREGVNVDTSMSCK